MFFSVFKARENQSMAEIINVVVHNYELDRNLLRITCAKGGEEFAPAKAFPDLKEKLREVTLVDLVNFFEFLTLISCIIQVLHTVLSSCSVPVLQLIQAVDQIMKAFADSDVRPPFPLRCCGDDIFNIYSILRDFNYHYLTIGEIIQSKLQGESEICGSLLDFNSSKK